MKERYEERIVELEEERDAAIEDKLTAVAEKEKLEKSRRTESIQNSSISAAPANADVRATVVSEVYCLFHSCILGVGFGLRFFRQGYKQPR